MEIVIFGAGYIGTNLNRLLGGMGHDTTLIKREVADYHNFDVAASFGWADCVINASGFTGRPNIDECERRKRLCWDLNVSVPITITEALEEQDCRLIHIASGCIYGGYSKEFTEEDRPNMGMYPQHESSFYSKCKHAFECEAKGKADILRIRMPICEDRSHPRNYLNKISGYPRLINARNSKTYIPDLAGFIDALIKTVALPSIYNVVNHGAMTTQEVVAACGMPEPEEWVLPDDLKLTAPRSNCILSNAKASKIYNFREEKEIYEL